MVSKPNVKPRNSLATSSLVLGILSSVPLAGVTLLNLSNLTMTFVAIETLFGIAAIILGIVSLKRDGQNTLAVIGVTLGTLTIASIVLVIWILIEAFSNFSIQ
jgi:hypothetical protein